MKNLIRSVLPLISICQLVHVANSAPFFTKVPQHSIMGFVDILKDFSSRHPHTKELDQRPEQPQEMGPKQGEYGAKDMLYPILVSSKAEERFEPLSQRTLFGQKLSKPSEANQDVENLYDIPNDKRDYGIGGGRFGKRKSPTKKTPRSRYFYGGGRFGRSVANFDHVDPETEEAFD